MGTVLCADIVCAVGNRVRRSTRALALGLWDEVSASRVVERHDRTGTEACWICDARQARVSCTVTLSRGDRSEWEQFSRPKQSQCVAQEHVEGLKSV
jgi:hypothetical protein